MEKHSSLFWRAAASVTKKNIFITLAQVKLGGCYPPPDGVFKQFHCKKCKKDF
jgi:hypothetical protein